jgi:hypothetical protein
MLSQFLVGHARSVRSRTRSWSVLAFLLAIPLAALANEGAVGSNRSSPAGGIAPQEESEVWPVSGDVRITLDPDSVHYRVRASYVLANPEKDRILRCGVPLQPPKDETRDSEGRFANWGPLAARSVEIAVAGTTYRCEKLEQTATGEYDCPDRAPGWCLADVRVPHGAAVPLALSYVGELEYEDSNVPESSLARFGGRTLRYRLFPAGFWAGVPERVTIRVDTDRFAGLAKPISPPGARAEGSAIVWDLVRPDLRAVGELVVAVDAEPVLSHLELVAIESTPWTTKLVASASSVLAPQGAVSYGPEHATDRDAATAWCEGKQGDGAGEWIEVRVEPALKRCKLEGFALVPGYAKSQATWTGNNRLQSFRIGTCGSIGGEVVTLVRDGKDSRGKRTATHLQLSDWFDRSALLVRTSTVELGTCVRLTILSVVKGTADDTCISELRPVFHCR